MASYTIRVYKDGNAWCALLGPDLQEGLAGWGENEAAALNGLLIELWEANRAGGLKRFADLEESHKYTQALRAIASADLRRCSAGYLAEYAQKALDT